MIEQIFLIGTPYEGIKREIGFFVTRKQAEAWIDNRQKEDLEKDRRFILNMTESDVVTYWSGVRPTLSDLSRDEYIVVSVTAHE